MQAPPTGTTLQVLDAASHRTVPRQDGPFVEQASPGLGWATQVDPMHSV